jgi:exodeoxyribonuclease VII small subunit
MAKFEDNLTALESVVERLELGDLSLEDSVRLFEAGVKLSGACKAELDGAEGRIQLLIDQGRSPMIVADLEVQEPEEDFGAEAEDEAEDEE